MGVRVCTSVHVRTCMYTHVCARARCVRSSLQSQVTASFITCLLVTLCGFAAGSSTLRVDQSFLVPPRRHSGVWGREREKGPSAGLQEYSLCACVGHSVLPVRACAAGVCELPVTAPHVLPVARGGSSVLLPELLLLQFQGWEVCIGQSWGRLHELAGRGGGGGESRGCRDGGGRSFCRDRQQTHVPESAVR